MTFLTIAAILCMLVFIFFMLMVIGLIPSERICEYLREHEAVQSILGIILLVGIVSAFFAVGGK